MAVKSADDASLPVHRRFIRFWLLVGEHFVRNRCLVRASALAYTTLLALIPLLAVGLGVSTSLLNNSKEKTAELITRLVDQLAPQLEQMPGTRGEQIEARRQIVEQIQGFIANIHSGALGLTGTVGLLIVAIGLLSTIEATFNDIWGVPRGRNWFLRVVHYWAAITLGPLVVIALMGLAIGSKFDAAQDLLRISPVLASLVFSLTPPLLMVGAFLLLYRLIPNTYVQWSAALAGAAVASVLWTANSNLSTLFASRVVAASRIYGSLGAIPILLFGLYLSWTILLFGAQVVYACQNRRAFASQRQAESINQRGREFVALRLMTLIGLKFHRGEIPPDANGIAESLSVPSAIISQLVQPLLQNQLLVEVTSPAIGYCPARPLDRISCEDILHALRTTHGHEPATREDPVREYVRRAFDAIASAEGRAAGSFTLLNLVEQARMGETHHDRGASGES